MNLSKFCVRLCSIGVLSTSPGLLMAAAMSGDSPRTPTIIPYLAMTYS
jgi:hypothetical protein